MHLILGAYNSWADPGAQKWVLCYRGRHCTDANVFSGGRSITCEYEGQHTALVNACHPQIEQQPVKMPLLWVCKESCREARIATVPADGLWSSVWWPFACIHTNTHRVHVCLQTIVFCGCNFVSGYNMTHRGWAYFAQNSVDRWSVIDMWGCIEPSQQSCLDIE